MKLLEKLKNKGLIAEYSKALDSLLDKEKITLYLGIDPTSDSLHLGHLLLIETIKIFLEYDHKVIILIGGATGKIGDPTGKKDTRKLLSEEIISTNISKLTIQLKSLLGEYITIVNNIDWLQDINYLDFLNNVCVFFNINDMLHSKTYSERIKSGGLSLFEFNYQVLQAYDYYKLHERYNVTLQIGGNDQLSNILAGINLINKKSNIDTYFLTIPLLVNKNGVKLGKSESGTIWLDKNKTPSYELYQYILNLSDSDITRFLNYFTSINFIDVYDNIQHYKKLLAYTIVYKLHGKIEADSAVIKSNELFNKTINIKDVNIIDFIYNLSEESNNIVDFINKITNKSKSEIRRLIGQKGIKINNIIVDNSSYNINNNSDIVKLSIGKHIHFIIKLE